MGWSIWIIYHFMPHINAVFQTRQNCNPPAGWATYGSLYKSTFKLPASAALQITVNALHLNLQPANNTSISSKGKVASLFTR